MIEAKMSNKLYKVQVGAFANKSNADRLCNELKAKGYSAFVKAE
jgi:N-acetylmuramoyl-L-alanine amidase